MDRLHFGEVIRRRIRCFFFGGYQIISQNLTTKAMMKSVLHRVTTWPDAVYFSALLDSIRPRTFIIWEGWIQRPPSRADYFLRKKVKTSKDPRAQQHRQRKAESMHSKGTPQTFLIAALRILKRGLGGPRGTRGMQAKGSIPSPSRRQRWVTARGGWGDPLHGHQPGGVTSGGLRKRARTG